MFRGLGETPARYVLTDDELGQIHQPVLLLWGEDDHNQSIADAKAKAGLIPNARFEVVPGGHEPWLDKLDACSQLMSAFLSEEGQAEIQPVQTSA